MFSRTSIAKRRKLLKYVEEFAVVRSKTPMTLKYPLKRTTSVTEEFKLCGYNPSEDSNIFISHVGIKESDKNSRSNRYNALSNDSAQPAMSCQPKDTFRIHSRPCRNNGYLESYDNLADYTVSDYEHDMFLNDSNYGYECLESNKNYPRAITLLNSCIYENNDWQEVVQQRITIPSAMSSKKRNKKRSCGDNGKWWRKMAPDMANKTQITNHDSNFDNDSEIVCYNTTRKGANERNQPTSRRANNVNKANRSIYPNDGSSYARILRKE